MSFAVCTRSANVAANHHCDTGSRRKGREALILHRSVIRQETMANPYSSSSRSPPPLQHPVPTHPAFIPDPPSTPASPNGYMRFTSSPPQPQPQGQHAQAFYSSGQPIPGQQSVHGGQYNSSQYQQFSAGAAPPSSQQQHQLPTGLDLSQWGVNPGTAQLGFQLGQSAMAAGQDYVQKNVCRS